jgi:type I restriction enzyme, R subunit
LQPAWHSPNVDQGLVKIIISRSVNDPPALFQFAPTNEQLERLSYRFRNPESGMQMVITADRWLNTMAHSDLDTVYLCRKMSKTALLQLIGGLSRISEGKQDALLVDYGENLFPIVDRLSRPRNDENKMERKATTP